MGVGVDVGVGVGVDVEATAEIVELEEVMGTVLTGMGESIRVGTDEG